MSESLEQRGKIVAEILHRLPKQRPTSTLQNILFWITILGTVLLVLDVAFFR